MKLSMKIIKKEFIQVVVFLGINVIIFSSLASEDVEYIRKMFSKENIQSNKLLCEDEKGVMILTKSCNKPRYFGQERDEIEKIILGAIPYFEVVVDVDGKPCFIESGVFKDRAVIFNNVLRPSKLLVDDKEELVKLTSYIGTIKKSSMPTKLANYFGNVSISDKDNIDRYNREREDHRKTKLKNREILEYRKYIIEICAEALPTWKKKMSEAEFKAFVAELEDLGNMNDLEKTILEQRVISEEERVKRVEAWFALPPEKRQ